MFFLSYVAAVSNNLTENMTEPQDSESKLYTSMNNNGDKNDRLPRLRAGSVYVGIFYLGRYQLVTGNLQGFRKFESPVIIF
jgi:hypothetical protein